MGLLSIIRKLKRKEKEMRILIVGLDNSGKTTIVLRINGEDTSVISPTLGFNIKTIKYQSTGHGKRVTKEPMHTKGIGNVMLCWHSPIFPSTTTLGSQPSIISAFAIDEVKRQADYALSVFLYDVCFPFNVVNSFHFEAMTCAIGTVGAGCTLCQQRGSACEDPGHIQDYSLNIWDIGGQKSIRSYWRNYFEQTDGLVWVVDSSDARRLDDCRIELHNLLKEERLAGATLLIFANKQDIQGALSPAEITKVLNLDSLDMNRHWKIFGCSAYTGEGLLDGFNWLVGDVGSRIYVLD